VIDVAEAIKEGIARAESTRKAIRESLTGEVPGMVAVDDVPFMEWVGSWMQQFPIQPCPRKDGTVVVASPWMLALNEVEGGDAVLKRIDRIMGAM
tara:strand:+ start:4024 stop:4308 length:285 start_codon:yes stop_codon:yes gene_type:complete